MAQRQQALPQPQNEAELAQVLGMMAGQAIDNEQIKQATAILKVFLKSFNCVQPLMNQVKACPDVGIRQMAAVLLRRKIGKHFRHLPDNVKQEIKQTLLDRLVNEESRPVRLSVAALISALAQKLVPDNNWQELLAFLLQCSESQQAGHREVSMLLFRALADSIPQSLKPHFATLQQIFMRGLSDPEQTVRLEALKALGVLAEDLQTEEEVHAFSNVIPLMVEAVKRSVQEGNEDAAAVAFEAFDNLAETETQVLVPHLAIVVQLMAEVTQSPEIDINIRDKSSLFIVSVTEGKPGKLVKLGLVPPLLEMCFKLACEPYEEESDQFESSEMTPQKIGVEILDGLALNTPKQFIYDTTMSRLMPLLNDANENMRKGALVILAVLAEGLAELFKPNLEQLLQIIIKSLQDQSALVRSAAAVAITQFSDYLQPEVLDCHALVVPCLFSVLDSNNETSGVKTRACTALDSFCERLGPEINPYVRPLMERLITVLKTSSDQTMQEGVISAIKSVAKSAEDQFSPFFHDTIQLMAQLMTREEPETLPLRAVATECVGAIACAVGKEKFAPFLPDAINLAMKGMTKDYFQLREATHNFFQSLCVMLGQDFCTLLPTVMPLLLASCESVDGVMMQGDEGDDGFGGPGAFGEEEDEEEDEDDEFDNGKVRFMIRSGALDEKLAAIGCIGTIASVCAENFIPYMSKTIESLWELVEYPHHYIRSAVLQTYSEIIGLLHNVYPNPTQWKPGQLVELQPAVKPFMERLMPMIVERMAEEDDKEVAASACSTLYEACKKFGPGCIASCADAVNEAVTILVMERAPCQMAYEDDDPEKEDHDEVLIDDVTNVIGVLAQMYGPNFEKIFDAMFPPLMKFCPAHRPATDRSMAIGCLAEVAEAIGGGICKYLEQVFPMVINGLADPSVAVRRNSAFCLGALCFAAGAPLHQHYGKCLTALQPLLSVPTQVGKFEKEQVVATKDNAVSVLAKMINSNPNALPMEQVVPVMLAACPLEVDLEEAQHVYPCIIKLFSSHTQLMVSQLSATLSALGGALCAADLLDLETRTAVVNFCKALPNELGAQLEPALNTIPPERKEAFIAAVKS